jgi:hypothetical protein
MKKTDNRFTQLLAMPLAFILMFLVFYGSVYIISLLFNFTFSINLVLLVVAADIVAKLSIELILKSMKRLLRYLRSKVNNP